MAYKTPPSRLLGLESPASIYFDAILLEESLREKPASTAERVRGLRARRWPPSKRRYV